MRKIPTIFKRTDDMRSVIDEVTPGCEWVLAGEGIPTRKWDGTCVLIAPDRSVWARREVKPGKEKPVGFQITQVDSNTGKTVGWEPAENSGFAKYIDEAISMKPDAEPGTYELCGPKINGNPERLLMHELFRHGSGSNSFVDAPRTYDGLREYLLHPAAQWFEGIVWHHPDGRMAKIKGRDFMRS